MPFETEIAGLGRVVVSPENMDDLVRSLPKNDALKLLREACSRDPDPHWNQAPDSRVEGLYNLIRYNED